MLQVPLSSSIVSNIIDIWDASIGEMYAGLSPTGSVNAAALFTY